MAFLPGYDVIGMHAITLLAVFRCLQGLALGGSWDGLPSLLALNAPPQRRGWYAMLGQLGAPIGFMVASALFLFLHLTLTQADFLEWGWRYPFFVAFAINVVALFARLRLVVTEEYTQLLEGRRLEPIAIVEIVRDQGYNLFLGAFAALASYALFHLVTVFPLSWIAVSGAADIRCADRADRGRGRGHPGHDGLRLDRRPHRPAYHAGPVRRGHRRVRAGFALAAGRRSKSQDAFILIGFALLGLSYGQASGTVTANFSRRFRYTGAALMSDMAWLFGAAFAPLVALGLSARFGLVAVSVYLLSGVPAPCWRCASTRRWKTRATEWLSHSAARGAAGKLPP